MSGRIIRDKLFFTTNYEGYIERSSSQAFGDLSDRCDEAGRPDRAVLSRRRECRQPAHARSGTLSTAARRFRTIRFRPAASRPQSQKLLQFFLQPNLSGRVHRLEQLHGPNDRSTPTITRASRASITTSVRTTGCLAATASKMWSGFTTPSIRTRSSANTSPSASRTWCSLTRGLVSRHEVERVQRFPTIAISSTLDAHQRLEFQHRARPLIPGLTNDPFATGVPSISITGMTGFGSAAPNTIWDENRRVADTFSFTHGTHSMKVGVDFQHMLLRRQTFQFVTGAFDFTGSQSGSAFADFLLDWPNQVQEAVTALRNPPRRTIHPALRLAPAQLLHRRLESNAEADRQPGSAMGAELADPRYSRPDSEFRLQHAADSTRRCSTRSISTTGTITISRRGSDWRAVLSAATRRWSARPTASSTT